MASSPQNSATQDSSFTGLFEDALEAYQKETGRDLRLERLKKSLKTPEDLLAHIELQGQQFENFRGKHGKLWSRMHKVLQPVAAIGATAQAAINSFAPLGPPASAVLGAVLYLVTAADGVKNAYDWIQDLFGEFEMFATRLQKYTSAAHDLDSALRDQLGAILFCMLRLFGRSEAMIESRRFREYLKVAFFSKDNKAKSLVDDLNVQLKNEQSLVMALNYEATRNTEDYSKSAAESGGRLETKVEELKLSTADIVTRIEDQKQQALSANQIKSMKQMLETPAVDIVTRILSTQKRDLVSGTGSWLEKETHFRTWLDGTDPILWILGEPGSGKSFLATWTILHVQKHFSQKKNDDPVETAVAYFFIKDYDTALLDLNNVLKTLALQIADVDKHFAKHVALQCMARTATATEDDTWENLFVGFYSGLEATNHRTILIIDGLDEAPAHARKKLLTMIKNVTNSHQGNHLSDHIRFAIFSRLDVRSDFEWYRPEKCILVASKNQDDIKSFIRSRLSEISLVRTMEGKGPTGRKQAIKLRNTIFKKVLQGADGVFLWAKLLMNELEELNSAQIGRVLTNSPRSLDGMIEKLFRRISQDSSVDCAEVSKMMMIICFAQRPLLFGELKLFLSLPKQQPDVLLWRNIRGRFASLFELTYPSSYDPEGKADVVEDKAEKRDDDGNAVTHGEKFSSEHSIKNRANRDEDPANEAVEATNTGKFDETAATVNGNNDDDKHDEGDNEDDEDSDEDFNFGDDGSSVNATVFDLGTAPNSSTDAQEYAKTIHDDDGQLKTSIRFTHQRIKNFLVDEDIELNEPSQLNGIWVNTHRAEIEMTINCLRALRLGLEWKAHRVYLIDYPAKNFVLHLANIQQAYLAPEDTIEIISGIVKLFHSDQASKALLIAANSSIDGVTGRDRFWAMWVSSQVYREVVQTWLRKPEAEETVVDQETLEWVRQARTSSLALLEPMMRGASEIWLTKAGHDDISYADKSEWLIELLRAYIFMSKKGAMAEGTYQDWSWHRGVRLPAASSERLYEAAEWAGLERTSHWHTGLGWSLMSFDFYDLAITEYDKAIELSSEAWVAMEGKARCLKAQGNDQEAIIMMNRAIEKLPQSLRFIGSYLYPWLSMLKKNLGDKQGAYEAAAQAFNLNCRSSFAQWQLLSTLSDTADSSQAVVHVLMHMHENLNEDGTSDLVQFFFHGFGLYDEIGTACKECGRPTFLLDAIEQALDWSMGKVNETELIWMTIRAAHVYRRYYLRDDRAIELYEKGLSLISNESLSDGSSVWLQNRIHVHSEYSLALFDMAVAAKSRGQSYSRLSTRLKELSVALDSSVDSHSLDFYNTGYPSLLWGRWLREHEGSDEVIWRRPFRARLLDQINMLDDNDPANDSYALKIVAKSLFHAGDRKNAGAILAILFELLANHVEAPNAQSARRSDASENEAKDESMKGEVGNDHMISSGEVAQRTALTEAGALIEPHEPTDAYLDAIKDRSKPKAEGSELKLTVKKDNCVYTCNNCGKDTQAVAEMYFCEICDDTNWCDQCLPKAQAGTLPNCICGAQHSFYRAWPIPEEARNIAATWSEGKPLLKREWLEALRAQWL